MLSRISFRAASLKDSCNIVMIDFKKSGHTCRKRSRVPRPSREPASPISFVFYSCAKISIMKKSSRYLANPSVQHCVSQPRVAVVIVSIHHIRRPHHLQSDNATE